MQKIFKNEKGSISLFVLLSALFFLAVVTSVSISFKNKERSINSQFEKIKSGYEKDVGNERQIYDEVFEPRAIFKTGSEVNAKMKQLAGTENATYSTNDTNIKQIKKATSIPTEKKQDSNIVSTPESNVPIYMWFDNGIIYYYSKDDKPELNQNSSHMFYRCTEVTSIDLSDFDTSNSTNMRQIFFKCSKLNSLDISNFDTSKVTSMFGMFYECSALTSLNLLKLDTTKVNNMGWMFYKCSNLKTLDLSKFDTSRVTNTGGMFAYCNSLSSLDVSDFDTNNVTNMHIMFSYCENLSTIYVSDKFVTDKFKKSTDLNGNEIDSTDMFYGSTKLVGGAGTVYDINNIDKTYAHIDGGTSNPGYFTAK